MSVIGDKGLDFVHEYGRLGLLGFARLDHFEQAIPQGLPLNVENCADSVGELPSLRNEHLLTEPDRAGRASCPSRCVRGFHLLQL